MVLLFFVGIWAAVWTLGLLIPGGIVLVTPVLAALTLAAPTALAQSGGRKVVRAVEGKPAPDFTVKMMDGKTKVTLSKLYKDKPVLLVFGSYT